MFKYFIILSLLPLSSLFAESSVWRISKEGKSFYLGGTCHFLRSSDYPLPAEFELAYALADTLVFEVDPAVLQGPDFTFQLLRATSYKDGNNLESVLSKNVYRKLSEQCERSGFSIETLRKTKPGMVVMMLMVKELTNLGVTGEGVDIHYSTRALNDQKKIRSLETADFQIDLIASYGDGIENKVVVYGLKDIDYLQKNFDSLIEVWKEGDLQKIDKQFVANIRKQKKLYSKLLVDRNKRWINDFEALLNTPEIEFVLVGVAHMAGNDGLISLLQREGYTIEQISVSF